MTMRNQDSNQPHVLGVAPGGSQPKTMIIGLSPEYNYPGKFETWKSNNTFYASNYGASLICNTLLRQFEADYISDFSDMAYLKNKYDTCVLALATHITTWRDVSFYADIVEQLDMKTIAPSLGVQDYSETTHDVLKLHPSIVRLLTLVSERSEWIGVRGGYTASVLYKNGFSNIVPIGCPTVYATLRDDLQINKPEKTLKPLIVYHCSLAANCPRFMETTQLLGQDYLDEYIFTDNLEDDAELKAAALRRYKDVDDYESVRASIRNNGTFPGDFMEWYETIGEHDFVFGPRLHGCIAALIQGIPAVLILRDLRTREMAEYFSIPSISLEQLKTESIHHLFDQADYSLFNSTYKDRYINYANFLAENKAINTLALPQDMKGSETVTPYSDLHANIRTAHSGIGKETQPLTGTPDDLIKPIRENNGSNKLKTGNKTRQSVEKVSLLKKIMHLIRSF